MRIKRTRFIKGHIPRSSSDEQQGRSNDNPCAPYFTQEKRTQLIEQLAWCAHEEGVGQSRHTQSNEDDCSWVDGQTSAHTGYTPEEWMKAVY